MISTTTRASGVLGCTVVMSGSTVTSPGSWRWTGLVDRREISVELLPGTTAGVGAGRRLIIERLSLVPFGELVWAQVAPGNAASLRTFLACGFTPVCAEVLIDPTGVGWPHPPA